MTLTILRISGAREVYELPAGADVFAEIERLIDATCLDHVNLRDGRSMWVDDSGHVGQGKPENPEATQLYHAVCRPGTTWTINGDVAITPEDWR